MSDWRDGLTPNEIDLNETIDLLFVKQAKIQDWINAYPVEVWPELTKEERDTINETLGGNMVSRLHASWARHILNGLQEILNGTDNDD